MRLLIIVNPSAGAGTANAAIPALEHGLRRAGVSWRLERTRGREHTTELVRSLPAGSIDTLVVVGGDGTINAVCQAYIDACGKPRPGPALCIVPAGTGGDFRRSLHLPTDPTSALQRVFTGLPVPVDLGVAWIDDQPLAFANIVSFGLSGEVSQRVNQGSKGWGGKATFLLAALRANLTYDSPAVALTLDGKPWYRGRAVTVAVANGQFFGGGMCIAPKADPRDGMLEVVLIGDASIAQRLMMAPRLYQGSHLGLPWVKVGRAQKVSAQPLRASDAVLVELDGETPGQLPLEVEILPAALRLYC